MPTKHGPEVDRFYHSAQWKAFRRRIIEVRHGKCERCGKKGNLLHHRIPLNDHNVRDPKISLNPDNIELVCRACHEVIHSDMATGFADRPTIVTFGRNGSCEVKEKPKVKGGSENGRRKNS